LSDLIASSNREEIIFRMAVYFSANLQLPNNPKDTLASMKASADQQARHKKERAEELARQEAIEAERQWRAEITRFLNTAQFKIQIGTDTYDITGRTVLQMIKENPVERYSYYGRDGLPLFREVARVVLEKTFGTAWKEIRLMGRKKWLGLGGHKVAKGESEPVTEAYAKCLETAKSLKLLGCSNSYSYTAHCRLTQEGEQLLAEEG
jgi:hypothetical protein